MGLILVLLFLLLGASGAATERGSATYATRASGEGSSSSLAITVWPNGLKGRSLRWTLRCGPAGGSLPRPAIACRRLNALRTPFAPVPGNVACTAIYGGPQVARVRGSFRGRRVDARFNRSNGCEIDRWDRVRFLFPVRR
jgi:hypothetical protein